MLEVSVDALYRTFSVCSLRLLNPETDTPSVKTLSEEDTSNSSHLPDKI